jgi:RHS repeat-associated protein
MRGKTKTMNLPNHYLYNANNQRTAKLLNDQIEEKYLWLNKTTLLAIYDKDDNLITRFYYSGDRVPYKVKHLNQIYYLSYNHIGSLKQITDTKGQTVKSIIYSAYGNIIEDTNPNLNIPIAFAGGLYDKDTKLIKFGYREYDSQIGRWITKDPIDFSGGDSNLYGYVLNDPINFVDPSGEHLITIIAFGITAYFVIDLVIKTYAYLEKENARSKHRPEAGSPESRERLRETLTDTANYGKEVTVDVMTSGIPLNKPVEIAIDIVNEAATSNKACEKK